jgi:filamentous hemagglutinin family protein
MNKLPVLLLPLGFMVSSTSWADGMATDGSVGAAQTLKGNSISVPQNLGKTLGNNLFHSFSDFNINTGQTVTFSGSDSLQNVISRVTGNNPSVIDGTLKSDIKNADFYFINPHGITFNANAQVDVPAAFHVSTADKMDFGKNGGVFYADLNKDSQLSSEPPSAFGFLGNSIIDNGVVDINNAHLQLKDGKTFDVVSGSIGIEGEGDNDALANIVVSNGQIRLATLKGVGLIDLNNDFENIASLSTKNGGNINIDAGRIDTTGDGAGKISIYGGNFSIANGKVKANNNGNMQAVASKGININAQNLNATNSVISADADGFGNTGNVDIKAANIALNEASQISADSNGDGKGGQVLIHDVDKLVVQNASLISSNSNAEGNGGNVNIDAKNINLDGGGLNTFTGIAANTKSTGQAGKVDIKATSLNIQAGAEMNSSTFGDGNANSVNVVAENVTIDGKNNTFGSTGIGSRANPNSHGQAGNIVVTADSINLLNGGAISSATSSTGNAGTVNVIAKTLHIDGQNNLLIPTGIDSSANSDATGNAGVVYVKADNLVINHGGGIGSNSFGSGNGGAVDVKAHSVIINGHGSDDSAFTGISANTFGSGDAGNVKVESNLISLIESGRIASNTLGDGNAGSVDVIANKIYINGNDSPIYTGIASNTYYGKGNGGNVYAKASQFIIKNAGRITSNTRGSGSSGNVTIEADDINIDAKGEYLAGIACAASPESTGQLGNINLVATHKVNLSNGAQISIQNRGTVPDDITTKFGGNIDIRTPNLVLDGYSSIDVQSTQNADAMNIHLRVADIFKMQLSSISTETNSGNGGDVYVDAGDYINLKQSSITTTVKSILGKGGDIGVSTPLLVLDNGRVQANAVSGIRGNLYINVNALIASESQLIKGGDIPLEWSNAVPGFNIIQAASKFGVHGSPSLLNLSGVLVNMTNTTMDNNLISQDYCTLGQGSSLSKKGRGALPYRPRDLQVY